MPTFSTSKGLHSSLKIGYCMWISTPSSLPTFVCSPDGTVTIDSCGNCVLQIKRPHSCRGKAFNEAADQKGFCLQKAGDSCFHLIKSHDIIINCRLS